ncbi:hypothetical protein BDR04DRAFT_1130125 [Suillus decipiens]|nr:hypothetical protein BDR04DRAFT_1130125 [Suillus decipiens]
MCTLQNSPDLCYSFHNNIKGYNIPGIPEKIVVNLYADDTTIYLTKDNKYSTLENILNRWCLASDAPWNEQMNIANDSAQIRILGTWIGNETDHTATWEIILEKIDKTLSQWNTYHPMLEGKRLITQMIVGGMTQFPTKAQGMPKQIKTAVNKTIRNFIWDRKKTSPLSLDRLQRPTAEGGINLLNINA